MKMKQNQKGMRQKNKMILHYLNLKRSEKEKKKIKMKMKMKQNWKEMRQRNRLIKIRKKTKKIEQMLLSE